MTWLGKLCQSRMVPWT